MKRNVLRLVAMVGLLAFAPPGVLKAQGPQVPPAPIRVVAEVLKLNEPQVGVLLELRQGASAAMEELHTEIAVRKNALAHELDSDAPDPAKVGVLLIQIKALERELGELHSSFLETFAEVLDPDQRGRLQLIVQAREVQPALPAFAAVGLIP